MKRFSIIFVTFTTIAIFTSCNDYIADMYLQQHLNDGLISYWPVVNESDCFKNYGPSNSLLSYIGFDYPSAGSGFTSNGKYAGAFSFSTAYTTQYAADSAGVIIGNNFTLSGWVFCKDSNNSYIIGSASGSLQFSLNISSGSLNFNVHTVYTASCPLEINNWIYVTCTYDGSEIRLYVNGNLVSSTIYYDNSNYSTSLYFGQKGDNTGWWNGYLDEIRVYDHALNNDEIKSLMDIGMY